MMAFLIPLLFTGAFVGEEVASEGGVTRFVANIGNDSNDQLSNLGNELLSKGHIVLRKDNLLYDYTSNKAYAATSGGGTARMHLYEIPLDHNRNPRNIDVGASQGLWDWAQSFVDGVGEDGLLANTDNVMGKRINGGDDIDELDIGTVENVKPILDKLHADAVKAEKDLQFKRQSTFEAFVAEYNALPADKKALNTCAGAVQKASTLGWTLDPKAELQKFGAATGINLPDADYATKSDAWFYALNRYVTDQGRGHLLPQEIYAFVGSQEPSAVYEAKQRYTNLFNVNAMTPAANATSTTITQATGGANNTPADGVMGWIKDFASSDLGQLVIGVLVMILGPKVGKELGLGSVSKLLGWGIGGAMAGSAGIDMLKGNGNNAGVTPTDVINTALNPQQLGRN
jgi:hypothetical protein